MKLKVGARLDDDKRRCAIARETVGESIAIAIDANQVWDVATAIDWIRELAPVFVQAGLDPEWLRGLDVESAVERRGNHGGTSRARAAAGIAELRRRCLPDPHIK